MEKTYDELTGKFNPKFFEGVFKQVTIYVNESQKRGLMDYLDRIEFHRYITLGGIESSWSGKLKHMNSHAWPGSDCMFVMTVREENLPELLIKLKEYRMTLPENIVFALGISPVDRIIPDLYNFDI